MTQFHRWFLYISTIVTAVSGVTYIYMKRFMTTDDPWAVINHPLEPWALKVHIIFAPAMLFAVGLIATNHIWRSLKSNLPTGRKSGVWATFTFFPLVLTGYLIQIVINELSLEVLSWSHLGLGLLCTWAILAHRYVLKPFMKRRKRSGTLPLHPEKI